MRWFCGILCALSLVVVAPAGAVLNGTPDTSHAYVGAFSDGQQVCSGFLVSATVAVTAGHCFADSTPGNPTVVHASFDPVVDPGKVVTGTVHVEPGYCCGIDNPQSNDVAVVVLDEPHPLQSYATLPAIGAADSLDKKAELTVVGYGVNGFTRGGGKPQPMLDLQRTSADVQVGHTGNDLSDQFLKLASSGGGNKPGVCFGDSGGPQLEPGTDTVLALTSFGSNGVCSGPSYGFRLDTAEAQSFIKSFE